MAVTTFKNEQLVWTRDPRGVWVTLIRVAENKWKMYEIAGPGSDLAKFLGGTSDWYLNMPDDTYAVFYTKRDAVAHAQEHFEKHFWVIARGAR